MKTDHFQTPAPFPPVWHFIALSFIINGNFPDPSPPPPLQNDVNYGRSLSAFWRLAGLLINVFSFQASKYESNVWDVNECCRVDWRLFDAELSFDKFNWSRDWWNFAEVSSAHNAFIENYTKFHQSASVEIVPEEFSTSKILKNIFAWKWSSCRPTKQDTFALYRVPWCIENKLELLFGLLLLTSSGDLRSNDGPEYSISVNPFFETLRSVKPWK